MAEQNGIAYQDGSTYQAGTTRPQANSWTNPAGLVEYSSAVTSAASGQVGTPFMRDRMALVQQASVPQSLTTQSTGALTLDGKYAPLVGDSRWQINSGRFAKARFLTDVTIRGLTTAAADDPAIVFRAYVRTGGSSGVVGAGTTVTFTRPRLADSTRIYAARSSDTGANFTEYSSLVIDNSTATGMDLVGLDANSSCYFIIGGPAPFCGIAYTQDTTAVNNADTTNVVYKYWNGGSSAWTTLTNVTVGNKTSSKVFAGDGQVSWDMPAGWTTQTLTSNSHSGYFVQGTVSTALASAAAQTQILVREVDLLFPIRTAIDVDAQGDDVLLALEEQSITVTGTPAYSGSIWNSWR